jgi:hypothetical protein
MREIREMGRLVLSKAVGAASRREVWGDGEMSFSPLHLHFFCPMPND